MSARTDALPLDRRLAHLATLARKAAEAKAALDQAIADERERGTSLRVVAGYAGLRHQAVADIHRRHYPAKPTP
jgi:chromosome segregation and condensation protein ScpB